MFVLYSFGLVVEDRFQEILGNMAGKVMFFSFYLFMIVLANLPTFAKHKSNGSYRAVGASGATSAVIFSSIVFEPTSKIYLFAALPLPAIVFGVLYLVYEHWAGKRNLDNIGHDAHFYGAIAGFIFTILIKPSLFMEFIHKITTNF
jgi:membrane associated rhomboid family serine protease